MKTLSKSIFRFIKRQWGRFFAVSTILALGIGVMSSLSSMPFKLEDTITQMADDVQLSDMVIKSTSPSGFDSEQIAQIANYSFVDDYLSFSSYDVADGQKNMRIYDIALQDQTLNKISLLDGRWPLNADEIVVERATHNLQSTELETSIEVMGTSKKVVGHVFNPLLMSNEKEPSTLGDDEYLDQVVYMDHQFSANPIVSDIYVKIIIDDDNIFSQNYKRQMETYKSTLLDENDNVVILTLQENKSFVYYEETLKIIKRVCIFFSFFFAAVALLVVLSTMKRMIEEERNYIACLKTLGYKNHSIIAKYLIFVLLTGLAGSLLGLLLFDNLIVQILYMTFKYSFHMPPLVNSFIFYIPFTVVTVMVIAALLVTVLTYYSMNKECPAALLLPKAPKVGRKTLIEKMPFIWKRLSFKYKSTVRNLFRYARHFIMAIISIGGSAALIFTGLSLYDFMSHQDSGNSISSLAVVLIFIAGLLSALVLYNLTNINIEERKREIATLMVLGYHDREVCGYIYRETTILSVIGIVFGLPGGVLFVHFLFQDIDMGSIGDIHWYMYIATIILTMVTTLLVELFLHRKILSIDMNGSLKSVD